MFSKDRIMAQKMLGIFPQAQLVKSIRCNGEVKDINQHGKDL